MTAAGGPPENEATTLPELIEQTIEILSAFSIPLYRDKNGRPELHGTGFFVKAGPDTFLVSAAHVMDTAYDEGLYFFSTPKTRRHLAGQLLRTGPKESRRADQIDVGVLRLSEGSAPPYAEVKKFAMDIDRKSTRLN